MLIRDCMTTHVELGTPEMSLLEAAMKMREGDFGSLPIHENDRIIGMITDRDIAMRAVAEGKDPKTTKVRDVMSNEILYCYDDQTQEEVAENLGENQVRRLPVMNRDKRLIGIVTLGDLARSDAKPESVERALHEISKSGSSHSQQPAFT